MLLVGYATPPRLEAFGEDELLFVDGRAVRFNRALDACKLAGAVLFCVGGSGMAVGLLLAACAQGGTKEELRLQQRFKERLAEIQASVQPVTRAPMPGEAKVPVTLSKVQNVQPGAETWPELWPSPTHRQHRGPEQARSETLHNRSRSSRVRKHCSSPDAYRLSISRVFLVIEVL